MNSLNLEYIIKKIGSQFDLVLIAAYKAHQIQLNNIKNNNIKNINKCTIISLYEIQKKLMNN